MSRKVFEITSESENLRKLRGDLKVFLQKKGLSKKVQANCLLAVSEGCTNSLRHAYGGIAGHKIKVVVIDDQKRIEFRIRDYGKKINLKRVRPPELPPKKPNGLGIFFLKTI